MASQKTEAVYFHNGRHGAPPETRVTVDGVRVRVAPTIKYLGLTLDGRWNFEAHFKALAPRVRKAGLALASLMKTQGGPGWHARRLYVGVVLSIALYGAPIRAPRLMVSGRSKALLRQAMRPMVVRAVRGYRTIAYSAATALAGSHCGMPPLPGALGYGAAYLGRMPGVS
ncbi:uncharacterized protein LOC105185625 [Harpegnathos saltator]|uniref:uncharacterized protein LOC105185625 n=1 Tax=Harpegnathos saltator TaxID=610380 RepID=UPI00058B107D|nr:uncharacterized protein LOC105185625 [Harpegnathos saltator]